jgi:hypothetical protein
MESNQFSTLLLMIKSITSITASHPVQFLKMSPNSVNQASQSVLRVLLQEHIVGTTAFGGGGFTV